MPRQQPEQGVRDTAKYRFRRTIGPCRGMDDSHDPSTLPDENVVEALNVRVHDGIVVCRGGQTPVLDSGMTGCVYGMVEVAEGLPRMFIHAVPVYGNLFVFNPQLQDPNQFVNCSNDDEIVNVLPYLNVQLQTSGRFCFATHGGAILTSMIKYFPETTDAFYTVTRLVPPEEGATGMNIKSETVVVLTEKDPTTNLYYSLGTPSSIALITSAGVEQSDIIYIGTAEGGVLAYDPASTQLNVISADGTFASRVILFEYHGSIFAASRDRISRLTGRAQGDTTLGSGWVDATLPGGVASFSPTGVTVLDDTAYICGFGDTYMMTLDEDTGGNMTLASIDLTGIGDPVEGGVTDVCAYNGTIYYAHNGSEYGVYVGIYDLVTTSWMNRYATIVGNTKTGHGNRLYTCGGKLFLLADGDEPDYKFSLYMLDDNGGFTVVRVLDIDGFDMVGF